MDGGKERGQEGTGKRRKKGRDKRVWQALALITQFGIEMIIPIFLCSFLGIWIDRKAGTSYWVIILFFVGALAGFTSIFRLAGRVNGRKSGSREGNGRRSGEDGREKKNGV